MSELMEKDVTMRDRFAMLAPAADATDLREILGWEEDLRIGSAEEIEDDDEAWRDSFTKRWHALSMHERAKAVAAYNYYYADAMLAARKVGGK